MGVANSLASEATWVAFDATVLLQGGNVELPLVPKVTLNETILGEMPGPGLSDGFRIDDEHRIWSSMPSGIVVIDTLRQKVIAKVIFNCNTSNVQFGADGDVWASTVMGRSLDVDAPTKASTVMARFHEIDAPTLAWLMLYLIYG